MDPEKHTHITPLLTYLFMQNRFHLNLKSAIDLKVLNFEYI